MKGWEVCIIVVTSIAFVFACRHQDVASFASADQPIRERATPIVEKLTGTAYGDSYTFAGDGCAIVNINGRVPIVTLNGVSALKVVLANDGDARPLTIYLRDIRFVTPSPERPIPPIKLNQLGSRPHMVKVAKISAPATTLRPTQTFRIVDATTGRIVFQGTLRKVAESDPVSGDDVWEADFTPLHQSGRYKLVVDGVGESFPFEVREDIYDNRFRDAVRFYFLQRCGLALTPQHAGPFAREACHLGDRQALTRDGTEQRDVSGGWHDAGDGNKYAAWVRYPLFMMLDLYNLRPTAFRDKQLNIPEAGNGIPDLLDEARWELDWLLKMQITTDERAGLVCDRIHESPAPPWTETPAPSGRAPIVAPHSRSHCRLRFRLGAGSPNFSSHPAIAERRCPLPRHCRTCLEAVSCRTGSPRVSLHRSSVPLRCNGQGGVSQSPWVVV